MYNSLYLKKLQKIQMENQIYLVTLQTIDLDERSPKMAIKNVSGIVVFKINTFELKKMQKYARNGKISELKEKYIK